LVIEQAAPDLVALIEGLTDEKRLSSVLDDYCASIKECDTVILGCTHYPLIKEQIAQKISGKIVDSIDPIIQSFSKRDYPKGDVVILYYEKTLITSNNRFEIVFKESIEVLKGVVK
jgi:glutamate racemase